MCDSCDAVLAAVSLLNDPINRILLQRYFTVIIKEVCMIRNLAESVSKQLEVRPINWREKRTNLAENIPKKMIKVIHFVLSVFLSRAFATRKGYILAEQLIWERGNPQIFVSNWHFCALSVIRETLLQVKFFFELLFIAYKEGHHISFHTLQNNLVIRASVQLQYFESILRLHNRTDITMRSWKELESVIFAVKILAATTEITKTKHHNHHSRPPKPAWNCDKSHH